MRYLQLLKWFLIACFVIFLIVGDSFFSFKNFYTISGGSFLLFPGTNITNVVDIFYLIFVAAAFMAFCFWILVYFEPARKSSRVAFYLYASIAFFCQIGGNLHYAIYNGLDVIPERNHFQFLRRFDIFTFLAGPAGVLLCGLPFFIPYLAILLCRKVNESRKALAEAKKAFADAKEADNRV